MRLVSSRERPRDRELASRDSSPERTVHGVAPVREGGARIRNALSCSLYGTIAIGRISHAVKRLVEGTELLSARPGKRGEYHMPLTTKVKHG